MNQSHTDLLTDVAQYYSSKLAEHGQTPQGVDWNGEQSQSLRFDQLSKIINVVTDFSVNDIGCGYGALLEYLSQRYSCFTYHGNDISEDMIAAAQSRFATSEFAHFHVGPGPKEIADYGMASGIFSVRLGHGDMQWEAYISSTLETLYETSAKGFSFNCLTTYSDVPKMKDYLYYANPSKWFDHCKRHFSRNVALLHDYDLYEFTILVRK